MKKIFLALFLCFAFIQPAYSFTLSNFDTPESFVVDAEDGSYYVSNINGDLAAKDGNGYISKINPQGTLVIQKFIGGKEAGVLNAPKGLVIVGKTIYVTDVDAVKGFDKETGKLTDTFDLSKLNAKFLNDIAADDKGFLYASDTMTNQIFKINRAKPEEVSVLKDSPELGGPNGIFINPKTKNLMIVTWETGHILEIDHQGKIHVLKRGLMRLDGLDYDNQGNLYVSSFEKGEIYKIPYMGRGPMEIFMGGLIAPADISCDRKKNELLIPSLKGNTVTTVPLNKKA